MLDGSRALSNGRWRVHEWTRGGEEGLDTFYKTVRKTSEQVVQTDRLLVQPNPFTITMQTGNTNKKSFSKKAEALSSPYFFVHKRLYLVLRLRRNKKKKIHICWLQFSILNHKNLSETDPVMVSKQWFGPLMVGWWHTWQNFSKVGGEIPRNSWSPAENSSLLL